MLTILRHDVEHRRGGPAGVWPDGTLAKYALILVEAVMPAAGLGQVDASQIAAINRCAMSYGGLLRDDALSSGNATLSKYDVSLFLCHANNQPNGARWQVARSERRALSLVRAYERAACVLSKATVLGLQVELRVLGG
jgi:hypothetical protein